MSVSGLDRIQRHHTRVLAVQAMELLLHHAPQVHYSQGSTRWDGISHHMIAAKGQFPTALDCSGSVTWALSQGLLFTYHLPDIVNGDHWQGGYTGTLKDHGRQVMHPRLNGHSNYIHGDLVLYGPKADPEHVAMIAGHRKGDGHPMVISQGSEPGPFYLPFDYRSDVGQIRRYI